MRIPYSFLAIIFCSLASMPVAKAATFNANNSADSCASGTGGFQQCLNEAQANSEADIILLAPGTYTGPFSYNAAAAPSALTIESATTPAVIQAAVTEVGLQMAVNPSEPDALLAVKNVSFTGALTGLEMFGPTNDFLVEGCAFFENEQGLEIEGSGDITLLANTFRDNISTGGNGGVEIETEGSTILVQNNFFENNQASDVGGAFFAEVEGPTVSLTMVNNVFSGNQAAQEGGAIFLDVEEDSNIVLTNNTFFENSSDLAGGAVAMFFITSATNAAIFNNIFFENSAPEGGDVWVNEDDDGDTQAGSVQFFNNIFASLFSVCQDGGGSCLTEGNNLPGADPLFVDAAAGNFELTANSPARGAGDPNAPEMPSTDIAGNPRPDVAGTNPDLGAFEFQAVPTPSPTPTAEPDIEGDGGCSFTSGLAPAGGAWLWGWLSLGLAILARRRFR